MSLAHTLRGAGERLVLVHGFTQNRHCWGEFADRLADGHQVMLVDAPGHGESFSDDADLVRAGQLLIEAGGRAHYVGYSMGGRMVLHAALAHAEMMQSMVLLGATAGIADPIERAARRRADAELADELEADGLQRFLDQWLAMPLFAGLTDEQQHRSARLANRTEGVAESLRRCGTGSQEPVWNRLPEVSVPTRLMVGENDEKFLAIAKQMDAALPESTVDVVRGAGHAVHLEAPAVAADRVAHFIRTTGSS